MSIKWVLPLLALISACAPQVFQRRTVVLGHEELERFDIRHAELQGCLLRRQVPVHYRLQRPGYELEFDVDFGLDSRAPELEMSLSPMSASARFPDLIASPPAQELANTKRYRIDMAGVKADAFTVEIRSAEAMLGRERISLQEQRCRGVSLGQ